MARTYLLRGLLVGLLAGLLATGFAKLVGEPPIDTAVGIEAANAAPRGEPPEHAPVSRDVQSSAGLGAGLAVAGAALGGIFALVFAFVHVRIARGRARATAAIIAAVMFIAMVLVPFLKYPANPPAVGQPSTLAHRTALYFLLLAISLLAAALAVDVHRRLSPARGAWNAALAAVALFVVIIGVAYVVMPGINEVPAGFPAAVLWRFRLASIGTQALLWAAIGLGFGALCHRDHYAPRTTRAHA